MCHRKYTSLLSFFLFLPWSQVGGRGQGPTWPLPDVDALRCVELCSIVSYRWELTTADDAAVHMKPKGEQKVLVEQMI